MPVTLSYLLLECVFFYFIVVFADCIETNPYSYIFVHSIYSFFTNPILFTNMVLSGLYWMISPFTLHIPFCSYLNIKGHIRTLSIKQDFITVHCGLCWIYKDLYAFFHGLLYGLLYGHIWT